MINRIDVNNRMSRITEYNNTIYFAGIVSDDKTLDIKGQTRRVLEIAKQRFELANTNEDRILRAEIFLKDIYRDFSSFNEIWDEWVSCENPPTRACVEANMASENTLLEIIFTAAKK